MNAVESAVVQRLLSQVAPGNSTSFHCTLCNERNRHLPGCVVPQISILLNSKSAA